MDASTPALLTAASVAMWAAVAAFMGEDEEELDALLLPPDTGPEGPEEPLLPLCPEDPACDGAGPGFAFPPPPVLDEGPEE